MAAVFAIAVWLGQYVITQKSGRRPKKVGGDFSQAKTSVFECSHPCAQISLISLVAASLFTAAKRWQRSHGEVLIVTWCLFPAPPDHRYMQLPGSGFSAVAGGGAAAQQLGPQDAQLRVSSIQCRAYVSASEWLGWLRLSTRWTLRPDASRLLARCYWLCWLAAMLAAIGSLLLHRSQMPTPTVALADNTIMVFRACTR
jgi:hypothetical protein